MRKMLFLILVLCLITGTVTAADNEESCFWAGGISALAPGLPVAAKIVYQNDAWGWQGEANYFYLLGMLRLDGRRILKGSEGTDIYGFAGLTLNHFNHYDETPAYLEFVLSADVGAGAEWRFSRRFGVGIEGGLMIPFWCNQGLEQFDNSGLMVANAYLVYWF